MLHMIMVIMSKSSIIQSRRPESSFESIFSFKVASGRKLRLMNSVERRLCVAFMSGSHLKVPAITSPD